MDNVNFEPIILLGMIPGSPAEKAGLKVGDVLFSVDDHPIRSYDDYIAASSVHGFVQKVTVLRGNQMLDLEIHYQSELNAPVEQIDYAAVAAQIEKAREQ